MPCKDAMITTTVISATPEQTVEEVLKLQDKHKVYGLPILENETVIGVFRLTQLMSNLLPINVTVESGTNMDLRLDYIVGAAPGIARRLQKMLPLKVSDLMEPMKDLRFVTPETPLWEGVRLLAKYDSPLCVVESHENNRFLGLLTPQSVTHAMLTMKLPED